WKRIAQNIPGRTAIQCRNRYIDTLNPSLKKGRYTAEDHFQLFMSIKKNGHRWSLVAKEMGRSKVAIAKLYSTWKCRRKVSRIR
ncbi:Homeodomain-like protein, partial [Rhizophagus diaphanus]